MKSLFITIALGVLLATMGFAQPLNFNYQGVARSAAGAPLVNQSIGLKISILDAASAAVYVETHTATTNDFGLYNLKVGAGTAVSGAMTDVTNLNSGKIKIEIDPAGGTSYVDLGTQDLSSVPFSFNTRGVMPTSDGGTGLRGSGSSSLWWGLYEGGAYRGYLGSYSGKNEDVDFGTGGGNNIGSVHLTVAAVPKFTVDSIGNVGVGTRYPKYRFQVDGITGSFTDNGIRILNTTASSGWSFYSSSSGALILGRTGNLGQFDGNTGVYTSLSDERLKTNIQPLESVLPRLMNIQAKRYEFKHDPAHKQTIGFIAQEVQQKFPEYVAVHTANDGNPIVENQLGVDYAGMSVIAIKAIQEQQAQIEAMKAEIAELKAAIKAVSK